MILQLWLAHPTIRNTDRMILDPYNWGRVPEPLDITMQEISKIKTEEDNPWN